MTVENDPSENTNDLDTPNASVVVVGSLTMDFTAVAPRMPELGETVLGTAFTMVPGGKGQNQAIAAARQMVPTAMVGLVGEDELGPLVRSAIESEGMVDAVGQVSGPTGVAHIMVDHNGDNRIIMVPQANARLDAHKVAGQTDLISSATVVLAQLEVPLDAVREAFAIARRAGVTTVLNPAPAAELDGELLTLCDIIIPNETEAAVITGVDTTTPQGCVDAARILRERGARTVIVTRGSSGTLVLDDQGDHHFSPFQVTAIDSTAAGDAFCGTLCAALAEGSDLHAAVHRGSAAGALATTVLGASPCLPTRAAVDALMAEQG